MHPKTDKISAPVADRLSAPAVARVKKANLLEAALSYKGLAGLLPAGAEHYGASAALGSALSEAIGRNAGTWAVNNPKKFLAGRAAAGLATGGILGGGAALASPFLSRGLSNRQLAMRVGGLGLGGEVLEMAVSPQAIQDISSRTNALKNFAVLTGLDAAELQSQFMNRADALVGEARRYLKPGEPGGGLIGNLTNSSPQRVLGGAVIGELASSGARGLAGTRAADRANKLRSASTGLMEDLVNTGRAPSLDTLNTLRTRFQAAGISIPEIPLGTFDRFGRVVDAGSLSRYINDLSRIADRASRATEMGASSLGLLSALGVGGLEGLAGASAARLAAGDLSRPLSDRLKRLAAAGGIGVGGEALVSGGLVAPVLGAGGVVAGGNYLAPILSGGRLNRLPRGTMPAAMGAAAIAGGAPAMGTAGLLSAPFVNRRSSQFIRDGLEYIGERKRVAELTKGSSYGRSALDAPVANRGSLEKVAFGVVGELAGRYFGAGRRHLGQARAARKAFETINATSSDVGSLIQPTLNKNRNLVSLNPFKRFRAGAVKEQIRQQKFDELSNAWKLNNTQPMDRATRSSLKQQADELAKMEVGDLDQFIGGGISKKLEAPVTSMPEYTTAVSALRSRARVAEPTTERIIEHNFRRDFGNAFGDLADESNRSIYEKALADIKSTGKFSPEVQFHIRYGNQYGDLANPTNKALYDTELANFRSASPSGYTFTRPTGIIGKAQQRSGTESLLPPALTDRLQTVEQNVSRLNGESRVATQDLREASNMADLSSGRYFSGSSTKNQSAVVGTTRDAKSIRTATNDSVKKYVEQNKGFAESIGVDLDLIASDSSHSTPMAKMQAMVDAVANAYQSSRVKAVHTIIGDLAGRSNQKTVETRELFDAILNSSATSEAMYTKEIGKAAESAGLAPGTPGHQALLDEAGKAFSETNSRKELVELLAGPGSFLDSEVTRVRGGRQKLTELKTGLRQTNAELTQAKAEYDAMLKEYEQYLATGGAAPAGSTVTFNPTERYNQLTAARRRMVDLGAEADALETAAAAAEKALSPATNLNPNSKLIAPVYTRDASAGQLPSAEVAGRGVEPAVLRDTYDPLEPILRDRNALYSLPGAETVRSIISNPAEAMKGVGGAAAAGLGGVALGVAASPLALGALGAIPLVAGGALAARSVSRILGGKAAVPIAQEMLGLRGISEGAAELLKPSNMSTGELKNLLRESGITNQLSKEVTVVSEQIASQLGARTPQEIEALSRALRNSVLRNQVNQQGLSVAFRAAGIEEAAANRFATNVLSNAGLRELNTVTRKVDTAYSNFNAALSRQVEDQTAAAVTKFRAAANDSGGIFRRPTFTGETKELATTVDLVISAIGETSPRARSILQAFEEATTGKARSADAVRALKDQLNKFITGEEALITLPGARGTVKLTPTLESTRALGQRFNVTTESGAKIESSFSVNSLSEPNTVAGQVLRSSLDPKAFDAIRTLSASNKDLANRILSGTITEVSSLSVADMEALSPGFKGALSKAVDKLRISNSSAAVKLQGALKRNLNLSEELAKANNQVIDAQRDLDALMAAGSRARPAQLNKARADLTRANKVRDDLIAAEKEYTTVVGSRRKKIQATYIDPVMSARVKAQNTVIPGSARVQVASPGQGGARVDFSPEELGELKQLSATVPRETLIGAVAQRSGMAPQATEEILIRNGIIESPAPNFLQAPVEQAQGGATQYIAPAGLATATGGAVYYGTRPQRSQFQAQQRAPQPGMTPTSGFGRSVLSAPVAGMHKTSSSRFSPLEAPVYRR